MPGIFPADGELSADDWFSHMPPRGSFGGELFDKSQLGDLDKELAAHGVELVRDAEAFLSSVRGGISAGFQALEPGKGKLYLKSNATVREVLHEMVHFRQFRDLGYDGYMALRKTGGHETQVWEWFLAHPEIMHRLNALEQDAEWNNYNDWKSFRP